MWPSILKIFILIIPIIHHFNSFTLSIPLIIHTHIQTINMCYFVSLPAVFGVIFQRVIRLRAAEFPDILLTDTVHTQRGNARSAGSRRSASNHGSVCEKSGHR